jgi:hypothetical protein
MVLKRALQEIRDLLQNPGNAWLLLLGMAVGMGLSLSLVSVVGRATSGSLN